jgi:polyhydroxyalkanoate synthesis regulator phasin
MKKGLAALLVVFGMALGSVMTAVLNPVGAASALVGASTTTGGHEGILQQALDTLVGKGTITKSQADAVKNQVHSLEQQHPRGFGHGMAAFGGPGGMPHGALEQLFAQLKTDPQALFAELKAGKTIAQIAQEKGINVTSMKNEVIAEASKGIDEAVKNGWMTAAQAASLKAKLPGQIDDLLNRKWNQGFGMPGMSGMGMGMPGWHRHGPTATPAKPTTPPPAKGTTPTTAKGTTPTTAKGAPSTTVGGTSSTTGQSTTSTTTH